MKDWGVAQVCLYLLVPTGRVHPWLRRIDSYSRRQPKYPRSQANMIEIVTGLKYDHTSVPGDKKIMQLLPLALVTITSTLYVLLFL